MSYKKLALMKNGIEPKVEIPDQKFQTGDFVRIAEDLGPRMNHFTKATDALVLYSYAQKYGWMSSDPKNKKQYGLYVKGLKGWFECSWYLDTQLEKITDEDKIELLTSELRDLDD